MIVYKNKGYEVRSDKPNEDWNGKAKYVVDDESELAEKIKLYYPNYDFVLDGETLVDVVQTEPVIEPVPPADLREQAYQNMKIRRDGIDLIPWEGKAITVDQANKVYLEYSAEGSAKATEIQALIVAAKTYIRELYPDE